MVNPFIVVNIIIINPKELASFSFECILQFLFRGEQKKAAIEKLFKEFVQIYCRNGSSLRNSIIIIIIKRRDRRERRSYVQGGLEPIPVFY